MTVAPFLDHDPAAVATIAVYRSVTACEPDSGGGPSVGCLLAVTFLMFGPAAGESAAGSDPAAHSGQVVIVAVPRLEWADLDGGAAPRLRRVLRRRRATALLSVRAIGPLTGLAEGFVTIGAGNRATFADRWSARSTRTRTGRAVVVDAAGPARRRPQSSTTPNRARSAPRSTTPG